ncbi:MAG TPA: PHP domain-containing protein [Tenuifilaceae bacterium]|nr:PHP domain-containing protein [Tenuifilaceae bacterium]HPE18519.1 PHP domain-containing protein [Tenuifilaceae bacterium]HPJ46824.1 PHP domain-containing protein [Tenuifilaceae bacterium]HPQ35383.1 PHP domain-containing protein [Tenuifilaceae bacterium]HRX69193.1 PHP domain-containing protein [Tenuifilaceae bacterium]
MKTFRADIHIHSVLSPCGDLDMSPRSIVAEAKARGLDFIAITDHNSTLHGPLVRRLAEPLGIKVFFGAEVTTREETHCLCLFNTELQRVAFQQFIEINLPEIKNDPARFGYQVVVNENDEIIQEIEPLLLSALRISVNQLEHEVHRLEGVFIPAHVDRPMYSLTSQLGFIPPDLHFDALEVFRSTDPEEFLLRNKHLSNPTIVKNSDAHFPGQVGTVYSEYSMEEVSFEEFIMALRNNQGRRVVVS